MKLQYNDFRAMQYALQKVDFSIPIKKYPDADYTNDDVCEIITIMRRQLDDVAANLQRLKKCTRP